jgi:hypothetical protein
MTDTFARKAFHKGVEDREFHWSDGYSSGTDVRKVEYLKQVPFKEANLISSELVTRQHHSYNVFGRETFKTHAPALDIDFESSLIPSSTKGHYHLFLDKALTWREYRRLLKALYKAGIIEEGFYRMTLQRKKSMLRTPWTKKGEGPHAG